MSRAALETVRPRIEVNEAPRRRIAVSRGLRLSDGAIRAIAAAREIAHGAGRLDATPRDLAAGIARDTNSLATRLLREHNPSL